MVDLKISQFADGSAIQTTDEIAAVRGGVNTKVFAGSAAALDAGLGVGDLIQLEDDGSGNARLPAIDISQGYGLSTVPPDGNYGAITISSGVWNFTNADRGDITISGTNVFTVDNQAITYAKIQNVSATDRVLGRSSAGAGVVEEITFTSQARQLCDDTSFPAMRTTLGLGTASVAAILGTVSQSGGVPTGAIIERGSNANGEYVKFADGTMICQGLSTSTAATTVTGQVFTGECSWTFPATFSTAPQVFGNSLGGGRWINAYTITTTAATNIRQWAATSGAGSITANMTAIGRWF